MDVIKVARRDSAVKAKKLRNTGMVPGTVYGGPLKESVSLQIEDKALRKLLSDKHEGSRATLELDGEKLPVQIKDVALDRLNNSIQNISFQALKAGVKVNSMVHIELSNTDKLVDPYEKLITEIPYASLPRHMIDTITIDVDGMPAGTVVTVADIKELQSDDYEILMDTDEVVLKIMDKIIPTDDEETAAAE